MIKNNKIIFIDTFDINQDFCPQPSKNFIPEWYKKTNPYLTKEIKPISGGVFPMTIKKCLPVFDSIIAGYTITTFVDVYVLLDKNEDNKEIQRYTWPTLDPIGFHPIEQASLHPQQNGLPFPKWMNPWSIKTPKGYSVLIKNPSHSDSIFTILEGIVDTDDYNIPINFPFTMKDKNFEGLIPAGTPIAQIIPFKRENWKMQIEKMIDSKKITTRAFKSSFSNFYRNEFRKDKKYE
jgi:hypothetical protein